MSRRRRQFGAVADNPFDSAHMLIHSKELDVYQATVDIKFTLGDVAMWMFPEEVIRKLKDAYPITAASYHIHFACDGFPLPSGDKVGIVLNLDDIKMQCPNKQDWLFSEAHMCPARGEIISTLQSLFDVHRSFNKVRKVIDWFGQHHVTPGAAAYYWPTILSLVPATHPVHEASGSRYREVTGISEIIPLLRETAGIVAGAHMCPTRERKSARANMTVTCESSYTQSFTVL